MSHDQPSQVGDSLSANAVSRLLPLGLSQPAGPVAALIERLALADGADWLAHTLAGGAFRDAGTSAAACAGGTATVAELRAVKESAKRAMGRSETHQEMLSATLAYFLSIGAALAHHNELLTSQPREQVDQALVDLADVLPDPWSGLLERAALITD
ncbi:MAG: hypothetical protein KDA21_01760 [Phycisphaerales bacterium]|nr:hypothetical protein [Phycisphaerales bacterium]